MYKILWSKIVVIGSVSITTEVCARMFGLGMRAYWWRNNVALTIILGPVVAEIMVCPGPCPPEEEFLTS